MSVSVHREGVLGHDHITVMAEGSYPRPAGLVSRRQVSQIARNSAFGGLESRLQKLASNSQRARSRILLSTRRDHIEF